MRKTCCVPDCEGAFKARGYCNKHLQQVNRKGGPYSIIELKCLVPDCENGNVASGYCSKHADQIRRRGAVYSVLKYSGCFVEGCERENYSQGYCSMHWRQIRDYGKLFSVSRGEPNEVVFEGSIARIFLYSFAATKVGETIIDKEDYPKVKASRWYLGPQGYTTRGSKKGETSLMHKMILQVPHGKEVDHRDRNRLNNRKSNLRPCTRSQNCYNSSIMSNNTSGVTGVSWDKEKQLWDTYIGINGKLIHLGFFNKLTAAANVRRSAELEYFKEFAPTEAPAILQQSL